MDSRPEGSPLRPHVSRHHGLLGTVVELRVWAGSDDEARAAVDAAEREVERLQATFSVFDPESELERWKRSPAHEPSAELAEVLGLARRWSDAGGGAFDPAIGRVVAAWDRAAAEDRVPTEGELLDAIGDHGAAAFDEPERRRWVNLNALAKGWIADRAADAGLAQPGVEGITVNAGGDLVHRHHRPLVVGIEDPQQPHDNVPPLLRVELPGGALATSGGSRRGWTIEGEWYGHVLDPRTGWPATSVTQVSVMAPDAATADVVATIVGVLGPDDGPAFVGSLPDVGCCVVLPDGELRRDDLWRSRELSAPS